MKRKRDQSPATDAEKKVWVEEAEKSGNISEFCSRSGISRKSFYDWKKKFGLKSPHSAVRRRHPHSKADDLMARVIQVSRENPEWGCDRIAYFLKLHGQQISSPTVQKILIQNGLAKKKDRLAPK